MMAAALDVTSGLLSEVSVDGKIERTALFRALDGDKFLDAIIHLGGFEAVDIINIAWAMAKAADDDIPDPRTWIREFETFPLDTIVPELFSMALKGLVSSKNLKRLKDLAKQIEVIQPESTSTPLSLLDLNEG